MATAAVKPIFLDTNVLIYAKTALSPFHAVATTKLTSLAAAGHLLCVSRQTFREYLAVMSRPGSWTTPVPMSALCADIRSFETQFFVAEDSPLVTTQLLALLNSVTCLGKQVHDANIVATMLAHGVDTLLTHNVADFIRFAGTITVLPLI
jgi:predicted nucleic acid-binding protein